MVYPIFGSYSTKHLDENNCKDSHEIITYVQSKI